MCKERAAELRDEILFRQPVSSHLGECPICCLPLPIDSRQHKGQSCCSKIICMGCAQAHYLRQTEGQLDETCPFCRQPQPKWEEEVGKNHLKRIESNNPFAMQQMGRMCHKEGDYESAFEYLTKAAELGDVGAHYNLSFLYQHGEGVEKDEKKELYHLEVAAIAGHPNARHNVGAHELRNCRNDRAVKHFIIAANLGYDGAIQALKKCYAGGVVSKEDFAVALRAYQAAVDATKSPQREAAAKVVAAFYKKSSERD
ncbi:zf-MYND and TPR domain-containing protein [Skeletonema marinoi]|uniref:Zf-MYND and TPR domain-containing protein n=1 Tax=Skeletonema marinoi TaxID=267567 RepID=A0AAD9D6R0_9STRA|nr:zf-MYND and TPR domain-containing protein [Skeletonema marinoi]